jgi:hypothetical protein
VGGGWGKWNSTLNHVQGMNQLFIKRLVCDKIKNDYILYQGILLVHQQVPSMYNQQALVETYLRIARIQFYIPCIQ